MNASSGPRASELVHALVRRRARRGSWAYMLWLLTYLPPLVWLAGDLTFRVQVDKLWLVLVPLLVVGVQLVCPTLLGWAVIFIPSVFFAGVAAVFVAVGYFLTTQGAQTDSWIALITAGVYLVVCVALWLARPKLGDVVVAEGTPAPNAAHAGPDESADGAEGPPSVT